MARFARHAGRYGVAVLAVLLALGLRIWLARWLDSGLAFVTVFGAVAAVVWWGGVGPGLLAASLGYVAIVAVFMPDHLSGPWGVVQWATFGSYAFSCGLIVTFGGALLHARRALQNKVVERHEAELVAAAERERLRITLSCIGDGVIVCDEQGRVVSMNPVAQTMTGWTQDEALRRDMIEVFDIFNERTGARVRNPAVRALTEGVVVTLSNHTVLRSRGGESIPIEDTAAPIVNAAGERIGAVLVFRDARLQRESERKLIEAHEALEVVVQSSPLAVIVLDVDPPLVRLWNGAAERLFGWQQREVIGLPLPIVPTDRGHEARRFDEQLREGTSLNDIETFRMRADGSLVDVRMSAAPLRDSKGAITGVLMMFADITDRVRAEASLRRSEATLRAFFDNAPFGMGVVELTADGDILHLDDNPVTCRLFGVEPGSTAGRRGSELGATPEMLEQWRARYQDSARRDAPVEFQYVHRIGEQDRRFRATVAPIGWGPAGRVRFCYLAEDITERHLAEARLMESEAGARLALQVARLGTWSWNARAGTLTVDARMREICGLGLRRVLHLGDVVRRVHRADWPAVKQRLALAMSSDGASEYSQEFRLVTPDGTLRWVVARGQALFEGQSSLGPGERRFTRMFGSLLDVTERKRNEEALAQTDRRKDEFLATLAHELRNPLAPLRNGVHLLRLITGDTPAADRPLSIMERQIAHMVRLIDDLLDVSRVSGSKLQLQRRRIDIAKVVHEAIETSQPSLDAAGHRLMLSLPDEPIVVEGDPTRLCQVIANLLNNAAKYTPRAGRVRVSVELHGPQVDVCVEDDGLGIPPDMLPRIFDMFTQVDQSLERSQGGLGIGLAIAKRLVEMHGGSLRAHSAGAGSGSRFVVSLPVCEAAPQAAPAPTDEALLDPHETAGGCRVLVADDNADSADSLCELLRLMGHEPRVARDGLEAFEVAAEFRPEMALLDIGMPKLNGYELARRLRQEPWGRAMRLVAVTGWGQDTDRRLSGEAGFDVHLVKPVDPVALDRLIDSVLEARNREQVSA